MDEEQEDHLKAYGLAYFVLKEGLKVDWFLNYKGGSFLLPDLPLVKRKSQMLGVSVSAFSEEKRNIVLKRIAKENMDRVLLEKAPRIAVYTPPGKQPWDDAVTLALEYAEIPYDTLWDEAVQTHDLGRGILSSEASSKQKVLSQYDWLHLHHEDFTGQFGKFWATFRHAPWYQKQVAEFTLTARQAGFETVREHKAMTARMIRRFVLKGGFLFAMCSATDTLDIGLAGDGYDFIPPQIDGTPIDTRYRNHLDFSRTIAFHNFTLIESLKYEHSSIDVDPRKEGIYNKPDTFTLFDFSAKIDTIPCLLNQNHRRTVKGFLGQTTAFHKATIKDRVVILGETLGTDRVKYIHGVYGEGFFTFLAGHDPEDYKHLVGDPPTDLSFHRNSPGYRLILNNILLPAARRKDLKT